MEDAAEKLVLGLDRMEAQSDQARVSLSGDSLLGRLRSIKVR